MRKLSVKVNWMQIPFKPSLNPRPWLTLACKFFPVIAFVLVLRSFLYEPFQIPSGSMMPTLLDGDFILVNKYNYGLRDPVARKKFIEIGELSAVILLFLNTQLTSASITLNA